jgi:hypothetical protein
MAGAGDFRQSYDNFVRREFILPSPAWPHCTDDHAAHVVARIAAVIVGAELI